MSQESSYFDLLNTSDWRERRKQILARDRNVCQSCLNVKYSSPEKFRVGRVNYTQKQILDFILEITNQYNSLSTNTQINFSETDKLDISMDTSTLLKIHQCINDTKLVYLSVDFETQTKIHSVFTMDVIALENKRTQVFGNGIRRNIPFDVLQKADIITWHYVRNLHVHHKYYRKDLKPWEYPDEALQTLCWSCHEDLHKRNKIPVYSSVNTKIGELTPCSRCYGAGYFPEYDHVQSGVCFECNGRRFEEF